ncbi:hypothetical protein [Nocardioides panacihumi]
MRRACAALATAVLLLSAGCGSDDNGAASSASSPSSSTSGSAGTEAWANNLCTAAATWKGQLDSATAQLRDTANLSANGLRSSLSTMVTATSSFASDLRDLGMPDTQAGDQAQQDLSDLGDTLDEQQQVIADTLAGVTTARQLAAALPALQKAITTMGTAFAATAQSLSGLDGADELKQSFESSSACQTAGIR